MRMVLSVAMTSKAGSPSRLKRTAASMALSVGEICWYTANTVVPAGAASRVVVLMRLVGLRTVRATLKTPVVCID